MPGCKYWKTQEDGFHGWCKHPEAHPCTPCILNTEDECALREEPEEFVSTHTCAVCGRDMPSSDYEERGCIFCGADSEEGGE